jgi:hypothetical protein
MSDEYIVVELGIDDVKYVIYCPNCGAQIRNTEIHDDWHRRLGL